MFMFMFMFSVMGFFLPVCQTRELVPSADVSAVLLQVPLSGTQIYCSSMAVDKPSKALSNHLVHKKYMSQRARKFAYVAAVAFVELTNVV
jgi:hypothetical protein